MSIPQPIRPVPIDLPGLRITVDGGGNSYLIFNGVVIGVLDPGGLDPVGGATGTNINGGAVVNPAGQNKGIWHMLPSIQWAEQAAAFFTTASLSYVSMGVGIRNLQAISAANVAVWVSASIAANNTAGDGVSTSYFFSTANTIPASGAAPGGADIEGFAEGTFYSAAANQVGTTSGFSRYQAGFQVTYSLYLVAKAITGGTATVGRCKMLRMET